MIYSPAFIQKQIQKLVIPVISALLVACGGGSGGSDGGGTVNPSGIVSGSVAGTTVIATNSQGAVLAVVDTAGRPLDVDTNTDSIPDAYSFTLTGLPLNEDIRLFLISDGSVYPVYFDTDGVTGTDTNVVSLTDAAGTTLSLGFVKTAFTGEAGRAVPQHSLFGNLDVAPGTEVAEIPASINEPPTTGLTIAQLNDEGLDALGSGWVLGARHYFEAAVQAAGTTDTDDANSARFLLAFTRLLAPAFDTSSDGVSIDNNRLGDLLDRFGVADDETRANWDFIVMPAILPDNSPTGNDVRDYLYNVLVPEFEGAIANLDAINPAFFEVQYTDPYDNNTTVESDAADILFIRGMFNIILSVIATQHAYDLGLDIDKIANKSRDNIKNNSVTVQQLKADAANATVLSLSDTDNLAEARGYLLAALDDFDGAITALEAEIDPQSNDLITIDNFSRHGLTIPVQIAEARIRIDQMRASITTTGGGPIGSATVDLQRFFDVNEGLDFRAPSDLMPSYTDNQVSSLFPDPTFNSIVLVPDLNEDVEPFPAGDGIPDIIPNNFLDNFPWLN